jgi:hypothetical protein
VSLKIQSRQHTTLIVCPNKVLFERLKKEKHFSVLLQCIYVYNVGSKILNNDFVEVSDSVYNQFCNDVVDKRILRNLFAKNIYCDTTFVKNGLINFNRSWEVQKAVIYSLLQQDIQCLYNCEGGTVSVFKLTK